MDDILLNTEGKMENTINSLENKFTNVRAGRANPAMLDGIMVEYNLLISLYQKPDNL